MTKTLSGLFTSINLFLPQKNGILHNINMKHYSHIFQSFTGITMYLKGSSAYSITIKSNRKQKKEKKTHLREMIHLSEQVSEHGVYVVHLQTVERGIQIFLGAV